MSSDTNQQREDGLRRWAETRVLALGWPGGLRWEPLRVEASHRRFYRIFPATTVAAEAPASLVLMDSPPTLENNPQFLRLADIFARHGVGVPRILDHEASSGWFLLSDLGSNHLADVYLKGRPDAVLPAVLTTLHRIQHVRDPAVPDYSPARFRDELDIFARWFVEAFLGRAFPDGRLESVFALLVDNTREQVQCCVHRDFHCRNLLLTETGEIGVVDFQDALVGPAAYDLASLLRDCYHRFPEADVARWRDAYLAGTDLPVDADAFARQLDLTAVQRQLKAVGIFARLHLRDSKSTHLPSIVPVLDQLTDLCSAYAELRVLGDFLDEIRPVTGRRLEPLLCAP